MWHRYQAAAPALDMGLGYGIPDAAYQPMITDVSLAHLPNAGDLHAKR